MHVSIDGDRCQGHGRCVLICPEVFAYDDDARGVVILAEPPPSLEQGARRAVANCPEQAITVASA